jgi:hypothetical protein
LSALQFVYIFFSNNYICLNIATHVHSSSLMIIFNLIFSNNYICLNIATHIHSSSLMTIVSQWHLIGSFSIFFSFNNYICLNIAINIHSSYDHCHISLAKHLFLRFGFSSDHFILAHLLFCKLGNLRLKLVIFVVIAGSRYLSLLRYQIFWSFVQRKG